MPFDTNYIRFSRRGQPRRERGASAIVIALSLTALIGFAGLVIDLGHLYVTKTELQNAVDACALAAANELVCDPGAGACPPTFLQNAEAAGIFLAGRNSKDFQGSGVSIGADEVTFSTMLSPNAGYLSRANGANPNSKFAMCKTTLSGIVPWFMGVLGNAAPLAVQATAVATLAPGQTSCNAAPVGVCAKNLTPPTYGYGTAGEWITSAFNNGQGNQDDSNLSGNFRWVDYTPNAGGTNEVRDQLLGNGTVCGLKVGDEVREQGVKEGTKSAWNTRFGIYPNGANAATPSSAPPDATGYAYPSKSPGTVIAIGTSAFADYRNKQAANTPFKSNEYAPSGAAGNIPGTPSPSNDLQRFGSARRLVTVPLVQCGQASTTILAMGCVLMLNPMSNGSSGALYLEWRGLASAAGSPCRSAGVAGGTNGPAVPTLVQ